MIGAFCGQSAVNLQGVLGGVAESSQVGVEPGRPTAGMQCQEEGNRAAHAGYRDRCNEVHGDLGAEFGNGQPAEPRLVDESSQEVQVPIMPRVERRKDVEGGEAQDEPVVGYPS